MADRVVIIGTGQAGIQAALSLRDGGFDGVITLVSEEADFPYQKPPLSKAYLLGKLDDEGILLKGQQVYRDYRLDLRLGAAAIAIDRIGHKVQLATGEQLAYDVLVLATGSRPRRLTSPGVELPGVYELRTLADAKALIVQFGRIRHATVVGAGFIGLEFAAVARANGIAVTVVEAATQPMSRVLSSEMAAFFVRWHIDQGVAFRLSAQAIAIEGDGAVERVVLANGEVLETDLVVVGIGAVANTELAEAAGLEVQGGVVVDDHLRTSDSDIYAIGDCSLFPSAHSALGATRVESIQNATDQGRLVAASIIADPSPYIALPWFWSDQGDLKLQIAGLSTGYDQTAVRGDPASGAFSVFCFRQGLLIAVETVNRGADHIMARRLLSDRITVRPEEVADETTPLKALFSRASAPA